MSRIRGMAGLLVLVLAAGAGCRGEQPDDQQTGSMTGDRVRAARSDWPAAASQAIDSGNAAYRVRDLDAARGHFERALREAGDLREARVTAYFGLYMVEQAAGNTAAADSAIARAQALAPEASLMHGPGGAMMPTDSARRAAPQTPDDSIHRRRN